ncbi:MAG: orotate phosphoribosyltransferase [Candidatus Cybelea sp.]
MSAPQLDLPAELARRGALLEGHFRLSSGRHSDRFVQKFRVLEDPVLLERVAQLLAVHFADAKPTIVVGAAVGGILLAYEVARQLGTKAIFVEKENGVPTLRRGFTLGSSDRALVVEDVVTTGLSVCEVIDVVEARHARVIGVGVIVARTPIVLRQGQDDKIPALAVLQLPIVSYDAAECPLCRDGLPITDPGSRRA